MLRPLVLKPVGPRPGSHHADARLGRRKAGRFISVVGPSGVGKDSVRNAMARAEPRIRLAWRIITRPAGAGGKDFESVSLAVFKTMREAGTFALCWTAHEFHYGIPSDLDASLAQGQDVLANLSRGSLANARTRFARTEVISLNASREVLEKRLIAREREDATAIAVRPERACGTLPEGIDALESDNSGPL